MILSDDKKGPVKFEDVSTLFGSINEKENDRLIEVYAPLKFNDEVDKRKKRAKFFEGITKILEKSVELQQESNYKTPS